MSTYYKVNNNSDYYGLTIDQKTYTVPLQDELGYVYDNSGNQQYHTQSQIDFSFDDLYEDVEINFLGDIFSISLLSSEKMNFIILATNIETFGKRWWDNYVKITQSSLNTYVNQELMDYVNERIVVFERDKNIESIIG